MPEFDYIWFWSKYPLSTWDSEGAERKGQRCRVLARAKGHVMRNILVEFEDGTKVITPRLAVRRYPYVPPNKGYKAGRRGKAIGKDLCK